MTIFSYYSLRLESKPGGAMSSYSFSSVFCNDTILIQRLCSPGEENKTGEVVEQIPWLFEGNIIFSKPGHEPLRLSFALSLQLEPRLLVAPLERQLRKLIESGTFGMDSVALSRMRMRSRM